MEPVQDPVNIVSMLSNIPPEFVHYPSIIVEVDAHSIRRPDQLRRQLIEATYPTLEGVVSTGNYGEACQVIFQQFTPQIPLANITSLTQANHDRAVGLIIEMLHVVRERVRNLIMWGINSSVQHADINHNADVDNLVGPLDAVRIHLNDDAWIMNELRRNIREHGYDIDGILHGLHTMLIVP
ncbi:hypothetical protein NL676_021256 [Syzygium grande]|nr:hypothetical protein NL676_021256 [Syzygium grande]